MKKNKFLSALLAPMLCVSGSAMANEKVNSSNVSTETVKNKNGSANMALKYTGAFLAGGLVGTFGVGIPLKMQRENLRENLTNKNLDYEALKRENEKLKEENDTLKAQNNSHANEVYNMLEKILKGKFKKTVDPQEVLRLVKNFCTAYPLVICDHGIVNGYECFGDANFNKLTSKQLWTDGKSKNRLNDFYSGDKLRAESASNFLSDEAKKIIIKNYLKCYSFGQMITSLDDDRLNKEIQNYKNMDELFKT